MGNLFSSLSSGVKLRSTSNAETKDHLAQYNDLVVRVNTRPDGPSEHSTYSYWFRDPPFPELVNAQSAVLPELADIVIIGSGITGASIARTLLLEHQDAPTKRIVMLEAREVCSGATGRNGGHIKPDPHTEYAELREKYGKEAAKKISDFRLRAVDLLVGLAEAEGYDAAECRKVKTADLFYDNEEFIKTLQAVKIFKKERPGVSPELAILTAGAAKEEWAGGEHCVGAITWDAGALWPYRLVTSIISSLLDDYPKSFTLETHTPVTSITVAHDNITHPYMIHTPRGHIHATHVIHATNGYSAHLIPGLTGKIFPARGQMSAQRPGVKFPSPQGKGMRSWCFRFTGGFDYITQRPSADGELLAGGGLFRLGGGGSDRKRDIGATDDSLTHFLPSAHLEGALATGFGRSNWGDDAPGGRLIDMWSGILGISADGLPWVGRLDERTTKRPLPRQRNNLNLRPGITSMSMHERGESSAPPSPPPGEWIAAGYTGEGMVNAWLCGVACAVIVLGHENVEAEESPGRPTGRLETWFPEELRFSGKRLRKADAMDMLKLLVVTR